MATQNNGKNPGDLDTSFGNDGVASFPVQLDYAQSRLLKDGRILTVGSRMYEHTLMLVRHLETGALDTSFGEQGVAYITPPFSREPPPRQLWILPDNSALILCALGSIMQSASLVLRVTPEGKLDTSFGVSGYCILDMGGSNTNSFGMEVLSDGKLILGLLAHMPGSSSPRVYLARLDNGHLDASFGTNGSGLVHVGEDILTDLIVLPNDGVLLTGPTDLDYSKNLFLQFLPDGRPDPAFGDDGMASLTLDNGQVDIRKLLRQADGRIVVTGMASVGFGVHTLTTRLNPHGSMDKSFNGGEPKIMVYQGHETGNLTCAVQADGKIVTGGSSTGSQESYNFVLMRFLADGTLDTSFGNNGQVMTNFGGMDECNQLEIQDDGKILAAGPSGMNPLGTGYVLARYLG